MNSTQAIKALEAYIKQISKKSKVFHHNNPHSNIGLHEATQSALEQIELYRKGKGRLSI